METTQNLLSPIKTRGDFRRLSEHRQPDRQHTTELPSEHPIWDVWLILISKYGAQWTHGDAPGIGWIHSLRDMTADQLRQGIDNLVHREDNHWPPNAEEFADLCRTSFTWETKCHKVFTPENKLEDHAAKEENARIGKETLNNLMDIFEKGRGVT